MDSSLEERAGTWALPEKYADLTPQEQAAALRASILAYLNARGPAAKSVLAREIRAPRTDTLQRQLDFLTTTQQIYVDAYSGSKDPTYYPNGRLAHPMAQKILDCGLTQYVIRAYEHRLWGRYVTVTQYAVLPSGEKKPQGGIRLDWVDLPKLIQDLTSTLGALAESGELITTTDSQPRPYSRR